MSDLDKEIQAARVRHYGQCPKERGHASGQIAITIGIAVLFIFIGSISLAVKIEGAANLRREAVERGYAAYDSATGQWGWK